MTVLARPEVVLGGDTNPLDRALRSASRKLESAGAKMQAAGARLSTRVTLPLAAIGVAATKASADWETAMVNIQKTVDATTDEISALGDSLVGMSERIPVSANELAMIASEAGQLGIATQNLRGFVETVAGLRVATNLGEKAGSTLARLGNIMGTAQTDFDRMGSTLVDLGNNLATTEGEIADMALRIAGAGRQIGLSEAQVLSFAGALSSVGIRAEAGGTAISRVMVDIATAVEGGGESLQRFASVAGMSVDAFRDQFETDAAGAITSFISGLGDLESQGKSTFGTLEELGLADIRVRDVLLRASSASDLFTDALDRGSVAWEENTALTREAGLFFNRLAARFTKLRNKAVNVTAEFGDALRPAIDRVIRVADGLLNVIRELVRRFAALEPEMRIQIAMWAGVAAAMGPVLIALGLVVTTFGSVLGIVAQVGVALTALAATVIAFKNNWLGMGEAGAAAWDTILSAATTALTGILNFAKPILNFIIGFFVGTAKAAVLSWDIIRFEFQQAFGKIRDFARPIMEGLATALSILGRAGKMAAFEIRNALTGGAEEGRQGGTRIGQEIAAGFAEAFGTDFVGNFVGIIRTGVERARAFIRDAIARLRELMGSAGGGGGGEEEGGSGIMAVQFAMNLVNLQLERMRQVLDEVSKKGRAGFDVMAEAAVQLKAAGVSFAVEFANAVGDAVTDGMEAFKRFGEFVLRTLARIAAKLVIFEALSAIFPGSQFVSGLGKAFGFAGEFAHGGRIPAGQFGLVAEARQPEVISHPALVAGPAQVTPATGSISLNVSMSKPANRSQARRDEEWVREIGEAIRVLQSNGFEVAL